MKEVKHNNYRIRLYRTLKEMNNDFIESFLLKDRMYLIQLKSDVKLVSSRKKRMFIDIFDLEERKSIYKEITKYYNYIIVYKNVKNNND